MEPLPITIIPSPELMAAIWVLVGICLVTAIILAYVELHNMIKGEKEEEEPEEIDPDPHSFTSSAETKPLRVIRKKK